MTHAKERIDYELAQFYSANGSRLEGKKKKAKILDSIIMYPALFAAFVSIGVLLWGKLPPSPGYNKDALLVFIISFVVGYPSYKMSERMKNSVECEEEGAFNYIAGKYISIYTVDVKEPYKPLGLLPPQQIF